MSFYISRYALCEKQEVMMAAQGDLAKYIYVVNRFRSAALDLEDLIDKVISWLELDDERADKLDAAIGDILETFVTASIIAVLAGRGTLVTDDDEVFSNLDGLLDLFTYDEDGDGPLVTDVDLEAFLAHGSDDPDNSES